LDPRAGTRPPGTRAAATMLHVAAPGLARRAPARPPCRGGMGVLSIAGPGTHITYWGHNRATAHGEAFNKADIKSLTELFDENASWHTPGRGILAGDRREREAVFAQFGRYGQETGGTFRAELTAQAGVRRGRAVGPGRAG